MKHNKYTAIIIVIMALISFSCLSLGVSYSYVMRSKAGVNAVIISTGDLSSVVNYTSKEMLLTMMNDRDGLQQKDYGEISISKDNIYSVFYKMNIGYAIDSIPAGSTINDLLPMEFIKVALFEIDGNTVSEKPIIGPISIADLTMTDVGSTSSPYYAQYLLNFGTFLSGSQSEKFALKVWLDEKTPQYDDAIVYLTVGVEQETLVSKSLYNISGTVVNSSGNTVSGAKVVFHNQKITTTSAGNGNYTLNNVPTGTYNISVIYNNKEYKTTIHIKSGDAISLQTTSPENGGIGGYIQNSAYSYYTTPGLIKQQNNLASNTNALTTTTYLIPKAYVLTGLESLSILPIDNVKLTLNANGTLSISKTS